MTNIHNNITYIDTETTQLHGRVGITEYGEVPDIENFHNQKILKRIKPNSTTIPDPVAIAVQNTSLEDLNAPDRVSEYEGAKFIDYRLKSIKSPTLAFHNSKFDLMVFNQNAFANLFPPHRTSNRDIFETMDYFRAAIALRPDKFQFYNNQTGKHSLSLNTICMELQNEEEKHHADDDCLTTITSKHLADKIVPEINSLINYVSIEANRFKLLDSSLLMKPILSAANGPSTQLVSRLSNYDWNNWDLMITIPDEFSWSGEVSQLISELKSKAKISVMKTKGIVILFPNKSNSFKKHYANYPDEKIEHVIKTLRQDDAYIHAKKEEMRVKYSKPKERVFSDIYHNEDGFHSPNDSYISKLFHDSEPKTKNLLCNEFEDHRLGMNAKIIMLHNYRDVMSNKEIQNVLDYELSELEKPEASRVTFDSFMKSYDEVCSDPKWSKEVIDNLNEYKAHVLALKANPKLFLEI